MPREEIQRRKASGFFEVLAPGDVMLLQREVEGITRKEYPTTEKWVPTTVYRDGKFVNDLNLITTKGAVVNTKQFKPLLYFSLPDQELVPLRNAPKELLSFFPAMQPQIVAFVDSRKLSWSKPADLAEIVAYVNTLSASH